MSGANAGTSGGETTILVVDDDADCLRAFRRRATQRFDRVTVDAVATAAEALGRVERGRVDAIVLGSTHAGLQLIEGIRQRGREVPFLCLSADGSAQSAVCALRAGALDYVEKGEGAIARAVDRLCGALGGSSPGYAEHDSRISGDSVAVRRLRRDVDRCARSGAPVRIEGETGAGKELVARSIHERSRRSRGPFVAVNCGALPEALAEAELFGHVRGAYTGATGDRAGLVEHAGRGTLLLDEIEDLPAAIQGKLLRLLQESEYRPVGSAKARVANVRILAASNRNLADMVAAGTFRRDLYYRLDVLRVCVPSLRERASDVPMLVDYFLRFGRGCSADGGAKPIVGPTALELRQLQEYPWPGNVRELQNVVERARAVAEVDGWREGWSSALAQLAPASHVAERPWARPPARLSPEDERAELEAALERHRWRREAVARELGVSRVTVWRRMRRLGLLEAG